MEENKNAYSEVIEILKLIEDEKKLEALPIEMLEVLKVKANPEYKPQISKEIPLEEQNLYPETFSILSWIALKYWDEEIETVANREQEKQEEKEPKTEPREPIEESLKMQNQEELDQTTLPVLYQDLKWYEKIKVRILEIFHKIFGKNNIEKTRQKEEEGSTL